LLFEENKNGRQRTGEANFLELNQKEEFRVVCFSPKHNLTLPEMAEAIENIVHTWQKRIYRFRNVDQPCTDFLKIKEV
jgi:UDPglucose--hexose-1-phosphate uridylyltransferase